MEFNSEYFLHALYVAFIYACLALGATAYRQVIDRLNHKAITRQLQLGEDIYFALDPAHLLITIIFLLLFIAATLSVIFFLPPKIRYYVIPLVLLINTLQLGIRSYFQRLQIKTNGLLGKNLFTEDVDAVLYRELTQVEINDRGSWSELILYYERDGKTERFRRRMFRSALRRLLPLLFSASEARIIWKQHPPLSSTDPISPR